MSSSAVQRRLVHFEQSTPGPQKPVFYTWRESSEKYMAGSLQFGVHVVLGEGY